jgi:2-hydroxychromene-2-carboxylate isomerase
MEKAWLSANGFEYVERNIAEDNDALDELAELGVFSTPATLIDSELVIGFDKRKLEALLHTKAE